MSINSCTTCAKFNAQSSKCLRVNEYKGGVTVTRPDCGSCMYWTASKAKEANERV